MADIKNTIAQADKLIKQGRYASAWKLLLPHKENSAARKRLKWLKAKRSPSETEKVIPAKKEKKRRGKLWWAGAVFGACAFLTLCSLVGQAVGIIPDATEIVQTDVAEIAATNVIFSQTPPTVTNSPIPTETATATLTSTFTPLPSDTSVPSATATITLSPTLTLTATMTSTFLPTNTVVPTNLPSPTATLELVSQEDAQLFTWLDQQADVEAVTRFFSTPSRDDSDTTVFVDITIVVPQGSIDVGFAETIRMRAIFIHDIPSEDIDMNLYMDDGTQSIAFTWNKYSNEWVETVVTEQYTPRFHIVEARSCPSLECGVIQTFVEGDILPSTGNIDSWQYIIIKGLSYYVLDVDVQRR